jgi:hypothetical protein
MKTPGAIGQWPFNSRKRASEWFKMFMIIFGAGASYDSVPRRPPEPNSQMQFRPPLAAERFQQRFTKWVAKFPKCKPIIHYLRSTSKGEIVEHELEKLQSEGSSDPERLRQVASIRHYLQCLIWDCEYQWQTLAEDGTNYVILLDQLRRVRIKNETVLLITFNYDRLIEDALTSVGLLISEFPHYIQNDAFKLFKLHGSVNWAREVEYQVNINDLNVWQVAHELISVAPDLEISDRFRIVGSHPIGKVGDIPVVPAIALPVETKSAFECPSDHLDQLCEHLGKVTKVVTIGWAAQEQHFLRLLNEHLPNEISVFAVAAGKQDAESVLERIKAAGIGVNDEETALGGFTKCAVNREFERFLTAVR